MGPSNTDNGRSDDPTETADSLGVGSGASTDAEDDRGSDLDVDGDPTDGEPGLPVDDDGLAPEAGRRNPSVLSLLLLIAGAIWVVVALLKIAGRDRSEEAPAAALNQPADQAQADAGPPLADLDDATETDLDLDSGPEPTVADETESSGLPDEPAPESEDGGDPANPRGPPEGSLLAGKVWPRDYVAPEIVHYTIKRGGSMKVVANLYKIFHHEMEALNPGVDIDRELPPSTKLVVYKRKPGTKSESVDYAGDGSLVGAMPMVDGPGRELKHTPWKGWGNNHDSGNIRFIASRVGTTLPESTAHLGGQHECP